MNEVIKKDDVLKTITPEENLFLANKILQVIANGENNEEDELPIQHNVHDGVYYRTFMLPKNHFCFGALLKVPTTLIFHGDCYVSMGMGVERLKGYRVLKGMPFRRQVFLALEDTWMTMCYRTDSTDVQEIEKEFTDEWMLLTTRREDLEKEMLTDG